MGGITGWGTMTGRILSTRRRFLQLGAATGALGLAGCVTQGAKAPAATASLRSQSSNRNALRLGIGGGRAGDSLDPATYTDSFVLIVGYQIMNGLVEIDDSGKAVPELLENWQPKPGAQEWVFDVRKGVTFHNGKTLDADDLIYSINRHRGTSSVAAGPFKSLSDVRKLGTHQIAIRLDQGNADLPTLLADYHMLVVPDGFNDWSHPIGTGAFRFESFEPGVSASTIRNPDYWKPDRGSVEAVQSFLINSDSARISALLTDEVDIINRVDPWQADRVKTAAGMELVRGRSPYHPIFAMQVDRPPYDKVELRRALKSAVDREAMVKLLFNGYGRIGNDHPIPDSDPFFNAELPQTVYDPEKAKFHLKHAGLGAAPIALQTSDAAFSDAIDFAEAYRAQAAKAGLDFEVVRARREGFWDNVWMAEPFVTSYWGGRPAATMMFDAAYTSNSPWNETHWRNPQFDALQRTAKTELDAAKRKQALWEMQSLLHDEGGAIIPAFRDSIDAHSRRVTGHASGSYLDMASGRIAEKARLIG
jgi:peptide/nickel transport system substrate-binding protein